MWFNLRNFVMSLPGNWTPMYVWHLFFYILFFQDFHQKHKDFVADGGQFRQCLCPCTAKCFFVFCVIRFSSFFRFVKTDSSQAAFIQWLGGRNKKIQFWFDLQDCTYKLAYIFLKITPPTTYLIASHPYFFLIFHAILLSELFQFSCFKNQ